MGNGRRCHPGERCPLFPDSFEPAGTSPSRMRQGADGRPSISVIACIGNSAAATTSCAFSDISCLCRTDFFFVTAEMCLVTNCSAEEQAEGYQAGQDVRGLLEGSRRSSGSREKLEHYANSTAGDTSTVLRWQRILSSHSIPLRRPRPHSQEPQVRYQTRRMAQHFTPRVGGQQDSQSRYGWQSGLPYRLQCCS